MDPLWVLEGHEMIICSLEYFRLGARGENWDYNNTHYCLKGSLNR